MSRPSSLLVLALCLLSLMAVSHATLTADCQGSTKTFPGSGTFTTPVLAGTGMVLTEPIGPITPSYDGDGVYELGVTIVPCSATAAAPGSTDFALGLYSLAGNGYTLVASTGNIQVNVPATGLTISRPVLFTTPSATVSSGTSYYVGFATSNGKICLLSDTTGDLSPVDPHFTYSTTSGLPGGFTVVHGDNNDDFAASATLCITGNVIGDPVFAGFNGQQFTVKGEAGTVFNLISTPTFSFNNRFVSLASSEESMDAAAMKEVRAQHKHSKLLDLIKGRPPVTAAWNHPGTYMGESGLTLGESKLYVQPGSYETGFAALTLNGVDVSVSSTPIELEGDMTVTRTSAFSVRIATPDVRFTIVNSDHFVNIEHATVLSSSSQLAGLLGQTAENEWEVVQSEEFKQHLENDFKLASNDLFGSDFQGKQF